MDTGHDDGGQAGPPHDRPQHAWRPGERRTLCGEWTVGWTVFWERAFSGRPGPGSPTCPACVEATLPEASRLRLDRFERAS